MSLLHGRRRRQVSLLAAGALEGAEREAALRHLDGCPGCRAEHAALRDALALAAGDPVREAEPPIPLGALVARVQARIAAGERSPRPSRPAAAWAWGAAAAALAVAVLLPRTATSPAPALSPAAAPEAAPADDESPEFMRRMERSVARQQAARYLDEAGDVLVTVAAKPQRCRREWERVDVGAEAERSRDLLARRQLLLEVDAEAVASARPVLDDVERMLREVASLEACARRGELDSIHREMQRSRLLMKIDLLSRELQG